MTLKKICVSMGRGAMRGVLLIVAFTAASFAQSVKLSVTTLTFANQLIGTTSSAKNITLTNTDSVNPLAIDGILDSGDYSETDTCGTSLAPSASCTIFVTFSPTVRGGISGAITIQDEASNSPQLISLTGNGFTPVSFSPPSLSFGTVPVGTKSPAKTVTVTNNQSTSATLQFSASGDYSALGSGATPCGAILGANSKCTLAVTFQPTVNGAINGALTIAYNAPFSPQEVSLSGTGSGGSSVPLTFSPTSLFFGNVVVNTTSAGKVVTVKNVSASAVTINTFPASGNYSASGSGATPCGGPLNAGSSCTFTVTFTPTLALTVPGAVTVADNAADSPQVLSLTGNGIQLVTLSPGTLTFAAQRLGTTSPVQTVTLANHQTADTLAIDSMAVTGDFRTVTTGKHPCGNRVAALASCTIGVVFAPAAGGGSVTGALTVAYNASSTPGVVNLSASATGLLPRFAYSIGSTLHSFTVDAATGQLRSTSYVLATGAQSVAVTPSTAFVYAPDIGTGNVAAFSANAGSGVLTTVSGSPFPGQPDAFAITVDPSSRFVYVANANSTSKNISGYTIKSATGALSAMSGSPFQAGNDTRALAVDPTGKFLYAANATSNNISAYTINSATGELSQIVNSPFSIPGVNPVPQSIAVDPATKFVFVGSSAGGGICAFTINPATGGLALVPGSPFANGSVVVSLAVNPSGRFLYTANDASNVSGYSIDGSTGALSALLGSPFAGGTFTSSVAADPSGRFLYVGDFSSGDLMMFTIDQNSGALTLSRLFQGGNVLGIALANGTTPVTYTPKFAYAANSDDNTVSGYTLDPESGSLTPVSGSPFKTNAPSGSEPQPVSLAVDPSGKFEYAVDFNGNGSTAYLVGYTINPLTGALTLVSYSPFAAGNQLRTVTIDPSGRFVYVTDPFTSQIYGFSIVLATGNLAPLSGFPFGTGFGTSPYAAAIDPSGRFLCAADSMLNRVDSFSIDPISGKLTFVSATATDGGEGVVVDPSGRFVYVAALGIEAYTISNTGVLTPISEVYTDVGQPKAVVVDPSGRFLYAANNTTNDVSVFAIDYNTGSLTPLLGSPFPAGSGPQSMTLDASGSFAYVANSVDNDLSAYTIDPTSGALVANPFAPFAAGASVWWVTTTGNIH
ncbi:putative 6-phosphogluconolactonase [Candidatus Sulfotelmatobacter kueseliae]|uniref:Putative 6-phosphogluconolactonase n=1 Tax=Candidatus Sulfotelmatobacter kueseliae TaxID=2042962 RepID=A0A2U3KX22_9BACT|nr:putative 6-phosphogluconolactonase [Candidatus Sulfotelmatobacter kueseliae]